MVACLWILRYGWWPGVGWIGWWVVGGFVRCRGFPGDGRHRVWVFCGGLSGMVAGLGWLTIRCGRPGRPGWRGGRVLVVGWLVPGMVAGWGLLYLVLCAGLAAWWGGWLLGVPAGGVPGWEWVRAAGCWMWFAPG